MKIGFFDSGIGGLTIFKEAIKRINAEYIYLGDNLNAPYGTKDKDEVKKYIFDNVNYLVNEGCEIIVIACNTATSLAIKKLREMYPDVCIIGTEPAVKKAVESEKVKRVLVAATSITVSEGKLNDLIERLNCKDIVDLVSLDRLVTFAESENIEFKNLNDDILNNNSDEIIMYLNEKLKDYDLTSYSHLVLGCTHFPLFKNEFQLVLGIETQIIDGSIGVVNNLENKIKLLKNNENCDKSTFKLILTKPSEAFENKFESITNIKDFDVVIKC